MRVGLGLGSNIGDKPDNIKNALALLEERGLFHLAALSSIYRTPPWGYKEQEDFANACAIGETGLPPLDLLAGIKAVEQYMGRQPTVRWGPRLIDIDILFYGDVTFEHEKLNLPHKDLFSRAFVLVPLAEIAPELIIAGHSITEAAKAYANEPLEKWDE
ncbi:MAG: 2-amino-4-hydroxy-6-hydroxymethyldihydropteridine diphosphokinase [Alphaproteobacteria bacterium]|nr:2-amino-4-hydroxy-6-hydroxymethyldihydropteridine diphosphokinase [Alphaproteobacteria bacterium]